jgi:diaminopimelate decarboxylase
MNQHDHRPVDVCGNSTYSRDFLARGVRMPLPSIGDKLAFLDAGAYCRSMITEFLGKDRPNEIVLSGEFDSTGRDARYTHRDSAVQGA